MGVGVKRGAIGSWGGVGVLVRRDGQTMRRTSPCASMSGCSNARHSRVGATGAYTKRPPDSIRTTVIRMGT